MFSNRIFYKEEEEEEEVCVMRTYIKTKTCNMCVFVQWS